MKDMALAMSILMALAITGALLVSMNRVQSLR